MATFALLKLGRVAAALLLTGIFVFGSNSSHPIQAEVSSTAIPTRDFPETGHSLSGEFLEFYERSPDGLTVYGYPITEAFIDPVYGHLIQYFQKSRFELFPNEPPEKRVQLSNLGEWLYQTGKPRALV